jgi:hypothetical protein
LNSHSNSLADYYRKKQIAASNFCCAYREHCRHIMKPVTLHEGRAGFVGSEYGATSDVPKILVISMDAGNTEPECTKSIEEEMCARRKSIEEHPRTHMLRTATFLKHLLGERFGAEKREYLPYFAMLNAAKCSRTCSADPVHIKLYDECIPYLHDEIGLLCPDIIWIQGKKTCDMLLRVQTHTCDERIRESNKAVLDGGKVSLLSYETKNSRKPSIPVIVTWHPRARPAPNFGSPTYIDIARKAWSSASNVPPDLGINPACSDGKDCEI